MNPPRPAAYQGKGWRPRIASFAAELRADGGIWAPYRVNSEYKRLRAVLLHSPGTEIHNIGNPNAIQHLQRIDCRKIRKEFAAIAAAFRKLGIQVRWIPRRPKDQRGTDSPNLMYARDLFFNGSEGVIVARMASLIRAGEERRAAAALAGLGVPILRTITGTGLFEAADALWIGPRTLVCGIGNRTNAEGCRQLREALKGQGVEVLAVALPPGTQHLLGLAQIVDSNVVLLRRRAPRRLAGLLAARGYRVIAVDETAEVTERQGMNIVTVAPRTIVMPDDCPGLRRLYENSGLTVAAQVDLRQIRRGAGGLACATGILSRDP